MDAHAASLADPAAFWRAEAARYVWAKFPETIVAGNIWFPDGRISASYNLVTRHVVEGRGSQPAVHWDSPAAGDKRTLTYAQLQADMEIYAEVLRNLGVRRGDRVLIYSLSTRWRVFVRGMPADAQQCR